jgi:hypothetical protein
MASMHLFHESRNLIGCWRGRIFPYCPRAYAIFIALRSREPANRPKIDKGATAAVKEISQYAFVSESWNYEVNFTMFVTINLKQARIVMFWTCEELQILFPNSQEKFDII